MKKSLSLVISFLYLAIVGCQKSEEDLSPEKLPIKNEKTVMALSSTPTAITKGMKNYESFFVSKVDGRIHGYIISVPLDYDAANAKQYPLLVFLHGLGERPNWIEFDYPKLKSHGPHKEIYYKGRAFPAIVASFQLNKNDSDFHPGVIKEFIDVLTGTTQVSAATNGEIGYGKYNIDVNKIHLTGLSLGGGGVYRAAFSNPNLFASISIFSGFTGSQSDMSKIKIPTYIRHNSGDNLITASHAYNAQTWINAANPSEPVNLKVLQVGAHDTWTDEYSRTDAGNIFEWHFSRALKAAPVITEPIVIPPAPVITNPPATGSLLNTELFPANNSNTTANSHSRLTLKFNTNVYKAGSGAIEVKNLTDNTSSKFNSDWGMVSVSGNTVSIYPVAFVSGKRYAIRIASGAFKDSNGNMFAGINDDNTWTFTAGNMPTAPVIQAFQPTSTYPAHNATLNRPSNGYIDLDLTFNKTVLKGSGSIKILNLTDNTSATVNANWGMVSVSGTKARLYPISVQSGKKYAITIAGDAFKDSSGTYYTGISNNYTWTFTVN